jgi:hypothetical protein
MPVSHSIEDLQPYLQPDYWDGHWPNDGDLRQREYEGLTFRMSRFVRSSLQDYLQRAQSRYPIESFRQGDPFDPAAYEPGTVVAYGRESLGVPAGQPLPHTLGGLPLKQPGLRASNLDFAGETQFTIVGDVMYRRGPHWGVVARTRSGRACLAMPVNTLITDPGTPDARVRGPLVTEHTPFVVGDVSHTQVRRTEIESIRRITNLEIVASGNLQHQRAPRTMFDWLGRLAADGA